MKVTWEDLLYHEPDLQTLENDIKNVDIGENSIHWIWSKNFKPRLLRLVGFMCKSAQLKNTWAYDIAYQHLYGILEDKEEEYNKQND